MKNTLFSLAIIALLWFVGFHYLNNNGDTNISFSENDTEISISAKFPSDKTKEVQNYLTEQLSSYNGFTFRNAELDANITIDDESNFYIKSTEGSLKIIMDRNKNSAQAYRKMKKMNEGLKAVLTK